MEIIDKMINTVNSMEIEEKHKIEVRRALRFIYDKYDLKKIDEVKSGFEKIMGEAIKRHPDIFEAEADMIFGMYVGLLEDFFKFMIANSDYFTEDQEKESFKLIMHLLLIRKR